MNAPARLHNAGQSIWLDNLSHTLLTTGLLKKYLEEFSVTGLTSNPTILDHAIRRGSDYDPEIIKHTAAGKKGEELLYELALSDLTGAADLLRGIHERTNRVDGWVSLEVSPRVAYDAGATVTSAQYLFAKAARSNLFIKIPGTPEGIAAIEESVFAGIPINVTLLFSREQYLAAAESYIRGIERRVIARLNPFVPSVASVFVSRWDVAVNSLVPSALKNHLGIAVAKTVYKAYRDLLASDRWLRLLNFGARPQRLLWASTGTNDAAASPVLYVQALAAPHTINTMPEKTLHALANHCAIDTMLLADDAGMDHTLRDFARAGIEIGVTAHRLQKEGAAAFEESWEGLLAAIAAKADALAK